MTEDGVDEDVLDEAQQDSAVHVFNAQGGFFCPVLG